MAKKLGLNCKLYYRVAGLENPIVPGNWTLLDNCRDVTLNLEKGEADLTTRGNAGWRAVCGTIKEGGIEFEMVWNTADPGFAAMQASFLNGTEIGILALDGGIAVSDSEGLAAGMEVMSFSRNEPLEEAVTVSVTVKPTYTAIAPFWHTVP